MQNYIAYFIFADRTWDGLNITAVNMDFASELAAIHANSLRLNGSDLLTWFVERRA